MGSWYYISQFGQIGPLGEQQVRNLIQGNIIVPDTPMWRPGMSDWKPAGQIPELAGYFHPGGSVPPQTQYLPGGPSQPLPQYDPWPMTATGGKSRVAAGVLNILLPGVGRLYLGYYAIGILQLVVAVVSYFVCCMGWVWSFIDGIILLTGGVSTDADGRPLSA